MKALTGQGEQALNTIGVRPLRWGHEATGSGCRDGDRPRRRLAVGVQLRYAGCTSDDVDDNVDTSCDHHVDEHHIDNDDNEHHIDNDHNHCAHAGRYR